MKILIFSPMVRIAMKSYLQCYLDEAAAVNADVDVLAPSHVDVKTKFRIQKLSGGNKFLAALSNLNPINYIKIFSIIKANKYDLVHVLNGESRPLVLFLTLMARLYNTRLLISIHDPVPHPCAYAEKLAYPIIMASRRLATELHIHEEIHKKHFVGWNKTIHIIPLPDMTRCVHNVHGYEKEDSILFIGRIEPYKGLDNFIKIALDMRGFAKFVIAGSGKIEKDIMEIIYKNDDLFEINNDYLSEEEFVDYLDRSRVCLLPYHSATQSGIPPMAISRKCVPVGFDVGGLGSQIINSGGIAVEAGNLSELKIAIKAAFNYDDSYLEMISKKEDKFVSLVRNLYSSMNFK